MSLRPAEPRLRPQTFEVTLRCRALWILNLIIQVYGACQLDNDFVKSSLKF